jgi:hypothetical protein
MNMEDQHEAQSMSLIQAVQSLPLMDDDLYLHMQVMNLGVVDDFLVDLERQLLREYMESDRTPVPDALFVSALSQMWLFAVYELLRTWRQRCRAVFEFAEHLGKLTGSRRAAYVAAKKVNLQKASPYPDGLEAPRWRTFERAANDQDFVSNVRKAFDSSELCFRKVEALRMHLAKHEMPKAPGSFAMAPWYGRINMMNGSIYWQVRLRGNEMDIMSRRDIADSCRELSVDRSKYMLLPALQKKVQTIPESSYGAKTVHLKLCDGTEYRKVFVLWDKEVGGVLGYEDIPFDVSKVVDVFKDSDEI